MSTPKPPSGHAGGLTFFIDRDLGRHVFPNGLRQAGLVVITLAEHYGVPRDQDVGDHEWMLEAARRGWPVPGCEAKHRRRRRPPERAALIEAGVQNFILNGNVSALENVERGLHNLAAILAACVTLGPCCHFEVNVGSLHRSDVILVQAAIRVDNVQNTLRR